MSKRILVIDDDPDVVGLVKAALKYEGFQIDTAVNGKQGLELAQANPPDVIILDIMMPEMNGGEVAKRLKAHNTTSTVPIIMLTALSEKKYMKAALFDLGVEFYVIKPFQPDDLIDKVQQAIQYRTPE